MYVFVALVSGVCVVALLSYTLQGWQRVTPIGAFLAFEIAATWPAFALYANELDPMTELPLLCAIAGGLLATLGFWLAGGFRVQTVLLRFHGTSPADIKTQVHYLTGAILLLSGVLVVITCYRFGGWPPLFSTGLRSLIDPVSNFADVDAMREGRRSMTKGYLLGKAYAGQGFLNALSEIGWQIVVVATACRALLNGVRGSLFFSGSICLVAFLFLGSSGHRSPIAFAAVGVVVSFMLYRDVNMKKIFMSLALMLALMIFIAPLSKGAKAGSSISERQDAIVKRISMGNGQNNVAIVKLVDSGTLSLGYGSVFLEKILVMIPGAPKKRPFALRLTEMAYGGGKNVTGFSTATQFGLLWADGAAIGVLVGYLCTGFVLAIVWRLLVKLRGPWAPVVAVQGALLLGYCSVTGIQAILSSVILMGVCVGLMMLGGHLAMSYDQRTAEA